MTAGGSWLQRATDLRWLDDAKRRRQVFALVAGLLLLLTALPPPYRAASALTPIDQSAAGLAPALAGLGAFASFLGNQQISEVHLRVARSVDVRRAVIARLHLKQRWGTDNEAALMRHLDRDITIRTLRGGILLIETKNWDAEFAAQLITAYVGALQERLGVLSREQTALKRQILTDRMNDASERLRAAEAKFDEFRRANGIPEPAGALVAAGTRLPGLQDLLRTREMALAVERQFATDDNFAVLSMVADIAEIKRQIELARRPDLKETFSVDRVVTRSTEYNYLIRTVGYMRNLYDSYQRLLEGTALEDLISRLNLRVIEPPHVEPDFEVNLIPLGLLATWLATLAALEFGLIRRRPRTMRHDG